MRLVLAILFVVITAAPLTASGQTQPQRSPQTMQTSPTPLNIPTYADLQAQIRTLQAQLSAMTAQRDNATRNAPDWGWSWRACRPNFGS